MTGMGGGCARTLAIASRIVSQFIRDPRTIALIVVAPILVMTLLGYVVTEKTSEVTVGLVDLDEGVAVPLAGVTPAVGASPGSGGLVTPGDLVFGPDFEKALEDRDVVFERYADEAALRQDVADGRLKGGLVIPRYFTKDVLSGGGFENLELILEGTDSMLSADIARRFAMAVQAFPGLAAERLKSVAPKPLAGLVGRLQPPGQPKVSYVYGGPDLGALSYLTPGFVAFAAFFFTFLLTSVAFLRERSSGTMERLLASPVRRWEIVLGYLLGFGLFALVQSLIILLFTIYVLGAKLAGGLLAAFVAEALLVAVAVVMGIFFSFYARNEFQVIQFIPIVVIPQVVLCGFITPLETLWTPLRLLAYAMPMTYCVRALRWVIIRGGSLFGAWPDLVVMVGFVALFTLLASRMIRRQVA